MALRAYRTHLRVMGQTSPPGLAQPVFEHVRGGSVVDVGCGSGVFGYLLRVAWHFTGSWRYEQIPAPQRLIGVDFSSVAIDRLRTFGIYDDLLLANASTLPLPDQAADTALSMENLEHLFPGDILPALRELARVARRRVVISTPAPWTVINRTWLAEEIPAAVSDPEPMSYAEFVVLAGCIHKAMLTPETMRSLGFEVMRSRRGLTQVHDSLIYYGEAASLRLDDATFPGVTISGYPADDGREDWRGEYVRFLRASEALDTSGHRQPFSPLRAVLNRLR